MRRVGGLGLLLVCVGVTLSTPAWGDSDDSFRKGMVAADLGRYAEAVGRFREAISEDSRESTRQILISGVFYTAYLPHYQLGRALLLIGESECAAALEAWSISERQGVVHRLSRPWTDLERSRDRCRAVVLPAALSAADEAIASAGRAARGLPDSFSDPGDETERRAAAAQLEGARRSLASARSEGDSTRADEALELARDAETRFASLAARQAAAEEARLETARLDARRAVGDADLEQRSLNARLQDPRVASARREHADSFREFDAARSEVPDPADLRRRFDGAGTAAEFEAVGREASALAARLRGLETRLTDILARRPEVSTAPETSVPPPMAPADAAPRRPASTAPSRPKETPATSPAPDPQVQRLVEASKALLARVADREGELLEACRERLGLATRAVDADPGETSHRRSLQRGYAALQVVAGAEALLAGQATDALDILSARDLPGDAVGGQGLFLRAAALFQLAQVDDERAEVLLERASRDIARFRALGAVGPPVESLYFSTGFWRFFAEAVGDGVTGGAAGGD